MLKNFALELKDKFFQKRSYQEFLRDLLGGVIVALVSIPISMGYAQIAGLPMQYGLYGSVLPILFFGLLTSSKDFVFGVDAAPAALIGAAISSMGIAAESEEALTAVPTMAFLVALWLLLFYFLKAGKMVQYISSPVMGGFVSGICCTIILMQIPKLYGGKAGTGEAPELLSHMMNQFSEFNLTSLLLGLITIFFIMLGKYTVPKLPVSVIMMAVGAVLTILFHVDEYGVKLLPYVENGFHGFGVLPYIQNISSISDYLFGSLSVAAVILAESLLASKGNAMKDGYSLNNNREILAYSIGNFMAALSGCCPVNGSVSRTGIVRQFGAKTQWLSVFAAISMLGVLYFGTFVIEYMPVPILTAIVISALINACEFQEAKHLWHTSKNEFYIFMAAFFGVLIFGTVYGVMIGIVLSFVAVIIRAVTPPRAFMGVIPGKDGFYSLERNKDARPVKETIIYRFGGNLFFANIDTFQNDIISAIQKDTRQVIIFAGAVGNIDITAAQRLVLIYEDLKKRGIKFYMTEHVGEVNDMLRNFGAEELLKNGAVRMTVGLALRDAGLQYPYELEESSKKADVITRSNRGIHAELEWVFGKEAGKYKEKIADELFEYLEYIALNEKNLERAESYLLWGRINLFDEDELIDRLETKLSDMQKNAPEKARKLEEFLEKRRETIEHKMLELDPQILIRLKVQRGKYEELLQKNNPEAYQRLKQHRTEFIVNLKETDPELAKKYEEVYSSETQV